MQRPSTRKRPAVSSTSAPETAHVSANPASLSDGAHSYIFVLGAIGIADDFPKATVRSGSRLAPGPPLSTPTLTPFSLPRG